MLMPVDFFADIAPMPLLNPWLLLAIGLGVLALAGLAIFLIIRLLKKERRNTAQKPEEKSSEIQSGKDKKDA